MTPCFCFGACRKKDERMFDDNKSFAQTLKKSPKNSLFVL